MSARGPWVRWLLPLATGLFFLVVWTALTEAFAIKSYVLPTPWEVAEAAWAERAVLGPAALHTMTAAVIGFVGAALIGGAIAMVLASSRWVRTALYPHVLVVQMIPVVVLAPLFVIWFRQGLPSVSTITFLIGFFPVVANATQGLISTERNHVELFELAGANLWQEFFLLRVPAALPYYLTGLRIAASLAMIGALTGELFAGSTASGTGGLGFMVLIYFSQLKTAAVLATGFAACFCGFVFVGSVLWLNWLLLHTWHDSIERRDR